MYAREREKVNFICLDLLNEFWKPRVTPSHFYYVGNLFWR